MVLGSRLNQYINYPEGLLWSCWSGQAVYVMDIMWGESSDSAFCPPPRGRRHLFFFCLLSHHFISYLFSFDTLFLHSFFSLHFYLDYSSPFCPSVFIFSLFPPSLFSMPHNLFLIRTYLPCKQADCTANRILNVTMAGKNQPRADTAQQCEPWHDKCTPPMVWQIKKRFFY